MRSLITSSDSILCLAAGPSVFLSIGSSPVQTLEPVHVVDDSAPNDSTTGNHVTSAATLVYDGNLYVACSVGKTVSVFVLPSAAPSAAATVSPSSTFTASKRVSCVGLVPAPKTLGSTPLILLSDKSGDVTCLSTDCEKSRHLYGHTASIITTMLITSDSTVFTADRDEKVRRSTFPNCHEIGDVYLGHTAFVSSLAINGDVIASSSGDHTIRVWSTSSSTTTTSVPPCLSTYNIPSKTVPTSILFINSTTLAYLTDDGSDITLLNYDASTHEFTLKGSVGDAKGCFDLAVHGGFLTAACTEQEGYVKSWSIDSATGNLTREDAPAVTTLRAACAGANITGISSSVMAAESGAEGGGDSKFVKTAMETKRTNLAKLENPKKKWRKKKGGDGAAAEGEEA
jgi:WD40 repeat protein